jgi:hypothetical protein
MRPLGPVAGGVPAEPTPGDGKTRLGIERKRGRPRKRTPSMPQLEFFADMPRRWMTQLELERALGGKYTRSQINNFVRNLAAKGFVERDPDRSRFRPVR